MTLPACLTRFDVTSAQVLSKPKRFYEVIISRPAVGVRTADNEVIFWSRVDPVRCFLTRETLDDRLRCRYLVCILREFDQHQ